MKTTDPATAVPAKPSSSSNAIETAETALPTASADPVVAEEVGHPIGVGIGALSAGAAGAAIGAVAGPIGIVVGALIGAVAGGLVGEEVASSGDDAATDNPDASYTAPDLLDPTSLATGSAGFTNFGESSEPSTGALFAGSDDNGRTSGAGIEVPSRESAHESARISHLTDGLKDAPAAEPEPSSEGPHKVSLPHEAIRASAYYRYIDREAEGRQGDALEDWILAERELQG